MQDVVLPFEAEYAKHVYHIYPVRLQNRDQVLSQLAEMGISCGIHYPLPIHLQDAYAGSGQGPGRFPVTEKYAMEQLSLPMFPELTKHQINYVVEGVKYLVK
jgi:dTDP-4-amino-4,6-dideoxygalactose transaminase